MGRGDHKEGVTRTLGVTGNPVKATTPGREEGRSSNRRKDT